MGLLADVDKKKRLEKNKLDEQRELEQERKKKERELAKKKREEERKRKKQEKELVKKKVEEEKKKKKEGKKNASQDPVFSDIKEDLKDELKIDTPEVKLDSKPFSISDIKKQVEEELKEQSKKDTVIVGDRVATGLSGLDPLIEGGFLRKSMILVSGGPGSGKSILSMNFLVNGIDEFQENGIYITFEQDVEKVLRDYERFNWDLKKKVDEGKLIILPYSPDQVDRFLEVGGGMVRDTIEKIGAKRVVFDSITAFLLLYSDEMSRRKNIFRLYDSMSRWGCTTLMISEFDSEHLLRKSTVLEFQADGVLLLYNQRKGDVRERSMEIFKMRATQHSQKIFPMKIDDSGITIFPEANVF
jgi:KaiC/GvpD/RAD55 family RecA-like ATPase